jgi:tripartite-type tricarboxylate transporter receptor subunit TctC
MSKIYRSICIALICVLAVSVTAGFSWPKKGNPDEAYPEKEIRIILPYSAGGQSDLLARKVAEIIEKKKLLSKPVVIVNIASGNTVDGIKTVKDSKNDGYTLLFHHTGFLTVKALGSMSISYTDLDMVAELVEQPFIIVARKDAPWSNIKEALEDAKKNPGKISIGFAGFGGAGHFALLNFLATTKSAKYFKQVPYKGGAEAIIAQIGGQIDLRISNAADAFRYIKAGQIKTLALLSQNISQDFPNVMNMYDLGIKQSIVLRSGVFVSKSTPKGIKEKLANVLKDAVESSEFQEFAREQGGVVTYRTAAAWQRVFAQDQKVIEALAKSLKKK